MGEGHGTSSLSSQRHHGSRHELSELHRNGAPGHVPEAKGMRGERREKGSRLGDSGHGRARGRGSAPSSHGYGSGSSWGALLRQGRRRSRLGEGRGGCGGAHRRRNRAKMAWLGRSTAAFVTVLGENRGARKKVSRMALASSGWRWRAVWGAFYRRRSRARPVAPSIPATVAAAARRQHE